jgi:ABC-2 type transport system permease protein
VPRSVESVLKEKAQLWGVLTMAYPLVVIGISAWYTTHFEWRMLLLVLIVAAGIPIYSMIAVSLGVFACDPQAVDARSRVRPTYVYLYMLLASFYTWSIYSSMWSQKLVVMVLTASLALALWQKARDALPYLLDPAAAPPPRVSTADGLIAATAFFILQGIAILVFQRRSKKDRHASGDHRLRRRRPGGVRPDAAGVLARQDHRRAADLARHGYHTVAAPAAAAAVVACVAGVAYLYALQHTALWAELVKAASASAIQEDVSGCWCWPWWPRHCARNSSSGD